MNNLVAKHARKFNMSCTFKDKTKYDRKSAKQKDKKQLNEMIK